jgi:hypothetical protein
MKMPVYFGYPKQKYNINLEIPDITVESIPMKIASEEMYFILL